MFVITLQPFLTYYWTQGDPYTFYKLVMESTYKKKLCNEEARLLDSKDNHSFYKALEFVAT